MHELEPFYNWRDYYIASEDKLSPFYGRDYSQFNYSQKIYNYYIHPQWDYFGADTLYCKILYVNYEQQIAVIEFIGEWNDLVHNDIMFLKRDIIDRMMLHGISKFVLIGENVLNFHTSDDSYYEEWSEEVQDEEGWIVGLNFNKHVIEEMRRGGLHYHMNIGENYNEIEWRKQKPEHILPLIEQLLLRSLN